MAPHTLHDRLPTGALCGVLIGFTFWTLPLTALLLQFGKLGLLWTVALPAAASSLGLALLACLVLDISIRARASAAADGDANRADRASRAHVATIQASVLVCGGVLALVADAILEPVLQQERELADAVSAAGGVLTIPTWLPATLCAVGALRAVSALRAWRR